MSPWKAGLWMVRLPPMLEDNEKTLEKVYINELTALFRGELHHLNASFREELYEWIDLNIIVIYGNQIANIYEFIELCIHCWTVVFTVLLMTLQAQLAIPVVQRPRRQRRRPIRLPQEDWTNGRNRRRPVSKIVETFWIDSFCCK